jgi:hypothetical protein
VWLQDRIPTTLITQTPVALTFFSMTEEAMLGMSDLSDSLVLEATMQSVKCLDPSVVSSILTNLRSLSGLVTSSTSHQCGGEVWSVLRCVSTNSDWLTLCVNCSQGHPCEGQPPVTDFSLSCVDSQRYESKLSALFIEFDERSPPPSFISQEVSAVTATSANVKVQLTAPGYLLCGAYPDSPSVPQPVLSEMLLLRGQPNSSFVDSRSSSPITFATYLVTGLVPASRYNLYCTSLASSLVPMSTDSMLRSKMLVVTKCCRLLTVKLNKVIVNDVSVFSFALTLDVGESMSDDELLTVSIFGSEISSGERKEMFSPSRIVLSPSTSLRASLTYLPVVAGTYKLNATLSGPSSLVDKLIFPAGDLLVVKGAEEVLSPPTMKRSEFSSDGSKITVTFTSPTNRGGVVPCLLLFELILSSTSSPSPLPSSSLCVWTSDSSLEISSLGSVIEVGDELVLKGGVLKARCTSHVDPSCTKWDTNDLQSISITRPSVVMSPSVVILFPSELGPCDSLIVDLTASSGSGGRVWKSILFVAGGSSPNITLLQTFLSSLSNNPSGASSRIVIPNALLSSGYAYSLQVRLCNFLGGCGSMLKSFVVSASMNVPVVLLNSQSLSIFRNATLSLSGDAYTTVCGGGKSNRYLSYSWSFSPGDLRSTSVNPRELKLPAYQLSLDTLYTARLTVKHLISMESSSDTVQVSVLSGDLKCLILGGDNLGLRLDGSLLLDMSESYDTNEDNTDPLSPPLVFDFFCFQTFPSYREGCDGLIFSPLTSSLSRVVVTINSSFHPEVTPGDKFTIVFRGKSTNSQDFRSCERVIEVLILDSLAPVLRLDLLSGERINPSSKLKIRATLDMKSAGLSTWSVNDESIVLLSQSLSPLSRQLPASPFGSPNVMSLVLVGNSLSQQAIFIFTLTCTLDNGYSSSSSVTVTTNSPPFGGVSDVSPRRGLMLETIFLLFSSGWVDEDLPLSMQFGYLTSSTDDMTVFRSKLPLSYTSSLLPSAHSGASGIHSNLTCVVVVFDSMDASSRSTSGVSVEAAKMSVEDLSVFLLHGINGSKLSSNTDDLKNVLSSTTTVLNQVNCSGSPDCGSLNREDCSLVEGTCGECLSGSVGLAGASNTRCLFGVFAARHLTQSDESTSSSPWCESNVDCANELFHECDVQSKVCRPIAQSCPNSCSGHGKCLFVSRYDPKLTFAGCGLLDVECVSVCDCEESHMGLSCSTPRAEFLKAMDLRQVLLESVEDLMARENADQSNVKSWIRSLSLVGPDSLSLSAMSKRTMSSLIIQILATSREVGLSTEDLRESGMDAVLDVCISGLSLSDPESETLLATLLGEHSALITSDMSDDQYPVSSVSSHLRSSSFALSSPTSSHRLSIPGTILETLSPMTHQSIELSSGILFPVQLTVAEVQTTAASKNSSENSSQLSLPLIVSFEGSPCSTSGGECQLNVTLQNKLRPAASLTGSDFGGPSFELYCVTDQVTDREYLCPSGDSLI